MDYRKEYEEAVKRARAMIKVAEKEDEVYKCAITIFPELKESEDERIRKWLIAQLVLKSGVDNPHDLELMIRKSITWLEKQGEPNPYSGVSFEYNDHTWGMCARDGGVEVGIDGQLKAFVSLGKSFIYPISPQPILVPKSAMEAIKEEKVDNQICIKPADKEKPKFKVGDWVVREYTKDIITINQVVDFKRIDDEHFGYTLDDETYFSGSWESSYRLWTIQDVRDGDIVVEDKIPGHPSPFIAIFKEIGTDPDTFNSRCFVDFDGNFNEGDVGHDITNIHPATKKQRDTLVAKMKEAGLTDFEKSLEHIMIETLECGDTRNLKADAEMLLRFIQKPIKWSENDEEYINDLIGVFDGQQHQAHSDEEIVNWLKTLKNKYV